MRLPVSAASEVSDKEILTRGNPQDVAYWQWSIRHILRIKTGIRRIK